MIRMPALDHADRRMTLQNRYVTAFFRLGEKLEVGQLQLGLRSCFPSIILPFAAMREYGRNYGKFPRTKPYISAKERALREDTEWDIRIDIAEGMTLDALETTFQASVLTGDTIYALMSGIEEPDKRADPSPGFAGPSGSNQRHVHIALVFLNPVKRHTALQFCRGPRKLSDEYAVPRNRKYTYAGWLAHHAKEEFKIDKDVRILFESGTLPMDPYTEEGCWAVAKILKKYGTKDIKSRFKSYYERLDVYQEEAAAANLSTIEAKAVGVPSLKELCEKTIASSVGVEDGRLDKCTPEWPEPAIRILTQNTLDGAI